MMMCIVQCTMAMNAHCTVNCTLYAYSITILYIVDICYINEYLYTISGSRDFLLPG